MHGTVRKNIFWVREAWLYSPKTDYREQEVIDEFEAIKKAKFAEEGHEKVELERQYVKYLYYSRNVEEL